MADPVRWLDGEGAAPEGVRELLQAAEPSLPLGPGTRERLAVEVARVAALPKAPWWATAQAKWIAGVSGAALAGTIAYGVTRPPGYTVASVQATAPVATPAPTEAPPMPSVLPAPPEPAEALTPRTPSALKPEQSEAAYLESARAVLASRPAQALALANGHRRAFPQGKLRTEADVIAAQALVRLGNPRAAAARAKSGLARAPNSIYAEQLRSIATGTPAQ